MNDPFGLPKAALSLLIVLESQRKQDSITAVVDRRLQALEGQPLQAGDLVRASRDFPGLVVAREGDRLLIVPVVELERVVSAYVDSALPVIMPGLGLQLGDGCGCSPLVGLMQRHARKVGSPALLRQCSP